MEHLSAPSVLFDPGYTTIDADIISFANRRRWAPLSSTPVRSAAADAHDGAFVSPTLSCGRRYFMFFKDERDKVSGTAAPSAAPFLGPAVEEEATVSAAGEFHHHHHHHTAGAEEESTRTESPAPPDHDSPPTGGGGGGSSPAMQHGVPALVAQAANALAFAMRRRNLLSSPAAHSSGNSAAAHSAGQQQGAESDESETFGHGGRWVPSPRTRARERAEERKSKKAAAASAGGQPADPSVGATAGGGWPPWPPAPDPGRTVAKAPKVAVSRSLDGPYQVATGFLMQPMTEGPQVVRQATA